MPGAVGAIVGARRARRPDARPAHTVSDKRLKAMEAEFKRRAEITRIFKAYDTNNSGKLEEDQVKKLLTDMDSSTPPNTPPSDDELKFIIKVADKAQDGCLEREELEYAIRAWSTYTKQRQLMEEKLTKYDKSGTGKLEKNELQEYLKDLNDGKEVSSEEVDWVMSEADVFGDGAMSRPELMMATAAWYAHVEEKKKDACCVLL